MKLTVERIQRKTWSGFTKYDNSQDFIGPVLSITTKKPITGLTKEDERRLEAELQLERGELRALSPFWDSYGIQMNSAIMELNTEEPEDELSYLFAKAHPFIANSYEERTKSNKFLYALVDKEDVAKEGNKMRKIITEAHGAFDNMSLEDMHNTLAVLGKKTDGLSQNQIINMCGKALEKDAVKFLAVVKDKALSVKITIMHAINLGVLTVSPGPIEKATILYDEIIIGAGLEGAARHLGSPAGQGPYITIKQSVDAQKRLLSSDAVAKIAEEMIVEPLEEIPTPAEMAIAKASVEAKAKQNAKAKSLVKKTPKRPARVIQDNKKSVTLTAVTGEGNDSGDFGPEE